MKAETKVALGTCSECYEDVFEEEEYALLRPSSVAGYTQATAVGDNVFIMHTDCCPHHNCNGNYEDVWCMDCGADYNNGRLS
jgi:hypothetical protein